MEDGHKTESYRKNGLKVLILFSHELAPNITFLQYAKKMKDP